MFSEAERKKILKLRREINRHNYLYYVKNDPEISDTEFDALLKELQRLENKFPEMATADSPTRKVGGEPVKELKSAEHPTPMYSMDNTYNADELRDFDDRVRRRLSEADAGDPEYVIEPKVDGVALNLIYRDGSLERAISRGNGHSGDEVTHNARTIYDLPLSLNTGDSDVLDDLKGTSIEVRGEVYIPFDTFRELNTKRRSEGVQVLANPRNAAAGSLKLLDPSVAAMRRLRIFTYEVGACEGIVFPDSHYETLTLLSRMGFPVNSGTEKTSDIEKVLRICESRETERRALNYPIDGLVVKVDSRRQRKVLGYTTKVPRYMIAHKFGAEQALSRVKDVIVQVGKSGQLTPVVCLEPVYISGTVVKRASLHNFDELARQDVRIGDRVYVEKAGEIIPQVKKVVGELREGNEKKILPPKLCPECGETAKKMPDGVYLFCMNPRCPAQLRKRIEHFGSRGAMDIEGLGEALVAQLVGKDLVKDVADLYHLKSTTIEKLERLEKKSAQNLVKAIAESKDRGLSRLLYGLGIPNVGSHLAGILALKFQNVDNLMSAQEPELVAIPEIGPTVARSVRHFFSMDSTAELITKLKAAGVETESNSGQEGIKKAFAGKRFVVTGTLSNYTRQEVTDIIENLGGRVTSDVSSNTDYLLAGAGPGGKLERAENAGVEVIDEQEFEKMKNASG